MELELSLPPSVNHMYFTAKNTNARLLTEKAKAWLVDTSFEAMKQRQRQGWEKSFKEWLYMDLFFFLPDRRKRDTHNTLKILLDGLEGILYENDYYVLPRIQDVSIDPERPRVKIRLSKK